MRFIKDYLADMFFDIKDVLREDRYMRRYLYASVVWMIASVWASIHFGLGWLGVILTPAGIEVMYFITRTLKRWDEQYAEQKRKDDEIMKVFQQELDDWGTER